MTIEVNEDTESFTHKPTGVKFRWRGSQNDVNSFAIHAHHPSGEKYHAKMSGFVGESPSSQDFIADAKVKKEHHADIKKAWHGLNKHLGISEENNMNEDSPALDTLKPGSQSVDYPKSKPEIIRNAIGAMHAMTSDELTKWFNQQQARAEEIGHGVGLPAGATAEHNKSTLTTHPSAASSVKESAQEDLTKILSEQDGLSEEFKTKATTLFEAALESRITLETVRLEEEFETKLTEAVTKVESELTEALDNYLDYAATEWLKENEVAVESALRNEIAQDFMNGLRNLFLENNISVPEDQVDIVDTLANKVEDLEGKLNDAIQENVELRSKVEESLKQEVVDELSEGLTLVEVQKLQDMSENLDYETIEEFKTKVTTIKESQFVKDVKKSVINEDLEEVDESNKLEEEVNQDPTMKRYSQAISRTMK